MVEYDVAGPVNVKFVNRKATCIAFVLPEIVNFFQELYPRKEWMY